MSDEKSQSPDPGEPSGSEPKRDSDTEIPVGDMTGEGQTEVGPLPSLTHMENLGQADLSGVAEEIAETKSSDEE
ncbi:MAG: hypothetical protein JWQ47_1367 [Glaciihabitans sp.]|nr:hypothetical protein [Glaciihabitans sp.]